MRKRDKQILLRVTEEEKNMISDYAYSVRLNVNECIIKLIKEKKEDKQNE